MYYYVHINDAFHKFNEQISLTLQMHMLWLYNFYY